MMLRSVLLLFLSLGITALKSQALWELQKSFALPGDCQGFALDQFGQRYFWCGDQLQKVTKGETLYYSDPLYGEISQVDVLNALQPLLFFEEANELRLLDNRLVESQRIELLPAGFIDPQFVAYSDQRNVWIYDQVLDELVRFDLQSRQITARSQVISQLLQAENRVVGLRSSFDRVVLRTLPQGLLIFDAQGALIEKRPDAGDSCFWALENRRLCWLCPGRYREIRMQGGASDWQLFPHQRVEGLFLRNEDLYLREKGLIYHYRKRTP